MSIEELLEQMEQYRLRREQRDYRPDWLKRFVESVAGLFEPLTNVGRVGYDCQVDERGWTICLYIGTTEIIGGPRDGQIDHASFCIDLLQLQKFFETIDRLEWFSVSGSATENNPIAVKSLLSVHGKVSGGGQVRLELLGTPPNVVKPGLHLRPDGVLYETL
ncbi:MAG: hypothetical protein WCK86_06655 [Planctomycetia bacterium]